MQVENTGEFRIVEIDQEPIEETVRTTIRTAEEERRLRRPKFKSPWVSVFPKALLMTLRIHDLPASALSVWIVLINDLDRKATNRSQLAVAEIVKRLNPAGAGAGAGLSRRSVLRGISALEQADLVDVERTPGSENSYWLNPFVVYCGPVSLHAEACARWTGEA